ncbi:glycosyltransferase family 2 protein [Methylosinus sp. LW4]|uniref:glycosyltransferase family 2 protein n=1 Tax=Methylosinus sp. LW4 TaxID=136993 RepID=UPI000A00E00E|nr:glycosyltransferase [Methylosinus sp. LW4]
MTEVSIILPTYNRGLYIRRAIDSVLSQTFQDFELIVVDDCSTDDTCNILSEYSDKRMRVIVNEQSVGAAVARNTGINSAKGNYIAFQDSDDVWLIDKLERQIKRLKERSDCQLCFGSFILFDHGQAKMKGLFAEHVVDLRKTLLKENVITPQTIVARAEFLKRHGTFDPAFPRYMDWDLALRVSALTEVLYEPEPLVVVFSTPGNLSSNVWNDFVARERLAMKHREKFEGHDRERAVNLAEAAHSAIVSRQYWVGTRTFVSALRAKPTSWAVWSRLCKSIFRAIESAYR